MKIIGFVGMPGSGKSVASDVARSMGLKVAVMGDVIRGEARRLGLEPTDENLGRVGNMLRTGEGPDAVARRTLENALSERPGINSELCPDAKAGPKVNAGPKAKAIVIDGLRSKAEADFFRSSAEEFHLIEIIAPSEARVKWIVSRGRADDPGAGILGTETKDPKIVTSCKDGSVSRDTAEALERRECRELSWGMCEAMREADLRVKNEGDLDDFRASIRKLLDEIIS